MSEPATVAEVVPMVEPTVKTAPAAPVTSTAPAPLEIVTKDIPKSSSANYWIVGAVVVAIGIGIFFLYKKTHPKAE